MRQVSFCRLRIPSPLLHYSYILSAVDYVSEITEGHAGPGFRD